MNKKIQEFAKYLGCEYVMKNALGNEVRELTATELMYISDDIEAYGEKIRQFKLILKEIEDISDEDFEQLNEIFEDAIEYRYFNSNEVIECYKMRCFDYESVDFLRSKGYAIGIDKEYYITEKELNKTK